ncbi:MAG: 1-acyl-sn-glycerol-3-phosphate acyltransferase [Inquilinus sp.]|nr:1-acyl-sn-glycerol-3-phosphate acyltransferase [Inquilinus sp.]
MVALRSLAFNIAFYLWTAVCCLGLLWTLVIPRRAMLWMIRTFYFHGIYVIERAILDLDYRVIGRQHIPDGPFILAAKHQSVWETMKLHLLVDDPVIVLKRELMFVPIWGWYAAKAKLIPVVRGAGGKAVASIVAGARERAIPLGRPIVIFPQGTRVAAGTHRPYRVGIAALYEALDLPVLPMALNSGVFWPRRKFLKKPGTITVEFLPPIPPGLGRDAFLKRLEGDLEAVTERLVLEVGGPATDRGAVPAQMPREAVTRRAG